MMALERMHQFIMYILLVVQPVSRGRSVRGGGGGVGGWGGGWGGGGEVGGERALGRIDVGVCYTGGARSRRWCGRWGIYNIV